MEEVCHNSLLAMRSTRLMDVRGPRQAHEDRSGSKRYPHASACVEEKTTIGVWFRIGAGANSGIIMTSGQLMLSVWKSACRAASRSQSPYRLSHTSRLEQFYQPTTHTFRQHEFEAQPPEMPPFPRSRGQHARKFASVLLRLRCWIIV